ncbi:MAG: helix-turn-helix transcriptional regulator [Pseudomonadota bacterium]
MKLATLIDHRKRVRTCVEYLAASLRARPQGWPSIAELAEVANLSPYHFIRVYRRATGETPLVTARRLKLEEARRQLLQHRQASVLDVALEHGYESAAAFSRAYARQFGAAPGAAKGSGLPAADAAQASLVRLPVLGMRTMALPRDNGAVGSVFDEFMGHLDLADVPRFGQDMFCVISPDLRLAAAGALQNPWVARLPGLGRQLFGGGLHACVRGQPDAAWSLLRRMPALPHRDEEHPILLRYLNDPAYKTRDEQLVELYVPLREAALR